MDSPNIMMMSFNKGIFICWQAFYPAIFHAFIEKFGFQNIDVSSTFLYHRILKGIRIQKGRQFRHLVFP